MSTGVYIGRFQPFHNGHAAVLRLALAKFDRVIVLLGSSQEDRTLRNPFSWVERQRMIISTFREEYNEHRLHLVPINDYPESNEAWVAQVKRVVSNVGAKRPGKMDVHLVGFDKDATSFYLKLLPWPLWLGEDFAPFLDDEGNVLGSTRIRNLWLDGDSRYASLVPETVADRLREFARTNPGYATLVGRKAISERTQK